MSEPLAARTANSLDDLLASSVEEDRGAGWRLKEGKCLAIRLNDGKVFTKVGSMIAYYGDLKFRYATPGGLTRWLKKKITKESAATMRVSGSGILYCADQGKEVSILALDGETLTVNGKDCLAFSDTLDWNIVVTRGVSKVAAAGAFSLRLTGTGHCAITTYGRPIVLRISPQAPLFCDPDATVAWSSGLQMSTSIDLGWKTLFGRSSKETFQLRFDGTGFVVIQPFEETVSASTPTRPL